MAKKKKRARKTQVSISLPDQIVQAIDDLADDDQRSRNQMFEILLREALDAREVEYDG